MKVTLIKSPRIQKKWRVVFNNKSHVDFGQVGYSDFTLHKDPKRMYRYLIRHSKEDWSINSVNKAGFWSRWLLWSEPNLEKAKKLIYKKFKIKIQ